MTATARASAPRTRSTTAPGGASPRQTIVPCLWIAEGAEEALELYASLVADSRIIAKSRYPEDMAPFQGMGPDVSFAGKLLTGVVDLDGWRIMVLNGGPVFRPNPAVSLFLHCKTREEVDAVHGRLMEVGGTELMALGEYPWNERFAWVQDRFGVSWQLLVAPDRPRVVPCMLFVGDLNGRAEEAVRFWTGTFDDSGIDHIERYGSEGPETEGNVQSASFRLRGQPFGAMDSALDHRFTFTEGTSLIVECEDQAEIDRLWDALAKGGAHSQCGWLKDRFGVSWQVVPADMDTLMQGPHADRVFAAIMPMQKLDAAVLEKAARGE